jgi:hypothetical protein
MEKKLTNAESLQIIELMINRAKSEEKDSGKGWIIWGWLLFIASMTHYLMIMFDFNEGRKVWLVFGVAGIILMLYSVYMKRFRKTDEPVKTYTGELVDRIGDAFFISLMVTVIGANATGAFSSGVNFGYLLLLYAFWLYIHGAAFRFQPMKYGAYVNWAGAIIIFLWFKELGRNILLVHAACVALGYIIPGYMAQKKFGKKNNPVMND